MNYNDDITIIKGIGDKTAKLYHKLGIFKVGDLIEYYPREYDLYERIILIESIGQDKIGKTVTIEGFINNAPKIVNVRNLNIISVVFRDESASIHLSWFNMPFLKNKLRVGARFIVRGKVTLKKGLLTMEQPDFITKEEYFKSINMLKPIYSLTKGLTNNAIKKAVEITLNEVELVTDYLPASIRKKYDLIELRKAIKTIHFPKDRNEMIIARKRIVFDEFFLFMLSLKMLKKKNDSDKEGIILKDEGLSESFIHGLGISLTKAQKKAWENIRLDIVSGKCMNRLVQGDVGSGKTVIAQIALFVAAKNGYQGLMMAPTEVLARQHYDSFCNVMKNENIKIGLLVGSLTAKEKREAYAKIKNHEYDIIIGTQALIQEQVEYDKVALVVTDEQHRFGVRQRQMLSKKGNEPHMMVMSATPIPRTLAMIIYGDLDISVIDELPKGRQHIKNCVVSKEYRPTAYQFITKQIQEGRQAYIICPMVEENEEIEAENVIEYTSKLRTYFKSDIVIEYLHGNMKPKDKNIVMDRFAKGEINILVSTTVVEVGVNVQNATVMMIENADRFGLAQLHQLRGRVGRGNYQSYCIMINTSESDKIKERLDILNKSNDGFFISNEDLRLRGPGELFGNIQSGELNFKLGDIFNDANTLKLANRVCNELENNQCYEMIEKNKYLKNSLSLYLDKAIL